MKMNVLKFTLPALALACVLAPVSTEASTIVWKDPTHGVTMSYPDSWRVQTQDTPNTILRVAGPLGEDLATCRMKVVADGRAQIYDKEYVDEAVSRELTRDFWMGEAAQFEGAKITDFYDPASLGGQGDATGVRVSYFTHDGEKPVSMYGIMLGSIYGKSRYIASCASKAEVFERWAPVFASILDSVDLDSKYHPFPTGYYRDFIGDPKLKLPRSKPGTVNVPEKKSLYQRIRDHFFLGKYHQ